MIGKQVGQYRVNLKLGEDGLGILYLSHHMAGGFEAVLRHFMAEFAEVAPVARYLEIARAASQVNHGGIWSVRETVWSGRNAFVAGEALPANGENLHRALQREQRFLGEITVKLGWQLAQALTAAHSMSVFHCCLRPEGVWVHPDPQALGGYRTRIMDFGIAAFLVPGLPNWRSQRMEALGLPFYMAPEQCRGGMVDFRSDIYSLGCILYHMAAGRPPFTGGDAQQIAALQVSQHTRGPGMYVQDIPMELHALIERMLAKEPAARPTMPQVGHELDRIWKHYWPPTTHERTVQVDLRVGAPPPPMEDAEEEEPRRWPLVAAIGGLGLAGAALALALAQPWKKGGEAPKPIAVVAPDAGPAEAATPPPPPPPLPPPRQLTPKEQALEDSKKAILAERWDEAAALAKKAQGFDPENKTAEILLRQARSEPANKKAFDDFMKSVADKDPKKAAPKLKKIPPDSLYAKRAKAAWEDLRKDFLHVKTAEAKALAETKACNKLPAVEKQVAEVFPESAVEIQAIAKGCTN